MYADDLAQLYALAGHRRRVGDQGEVALVLFDLGALSGVHRVFDGQRVQAKVGLQRLQHVLVGVWQVDPHKGVRQS